MRRVSPLERVDHHRAGLIREARVRMKIIETMHRPPVSISPAGTIVEAAVEMERADVGALGAVDGDQLVGIVTDRDLVRQNSTTPTRCSARTRSADSSLFGTVSSSGSSPSTTCSYISPQT